ncbi:MAG: glycosyltransferase family 4 protein [Deltaproteobacteria bacterium]|nr:glycosyltransferase family 4 protein [Deltaproteobacteria bacterium]
MSFKNPIRILRIIARLNIGGPAIQAISLSKNLSKEVYQTILVCGRVEPHEGDMSYLAREKGIQPHILPGLGREISPTGDLDSFRAIRKTIKRFRPHIIHTHTAKAGAVGRLAAISLNVSRKPGDRIRLVHTFHGHIFHSYFGFLKTFIFIQIERFLAKFTDRIIVISPLQKRDICERFRIAGPEKVRIIPLGFDLSNFIGSESQRENIREKYLVNDSRETLLVGSIGRLTHVKNHRMLLEAVNCLKDKGKDTHFRFLIVGDGQLREELMKYSEELDVQESIIFTGWQKDMTSIYGAMDIVTLTSFNEGTPVTLIEAMAATKPVVATDVGGVRDLLGIIDKRSTHGYKLARNGILVPSGRGEILARALLFLLENRDVSKKMAEHAREFVLNRYSIERLVKDIEALYREL